MKFKALVLALAVAGVGASFGLTDTGRSDTGTTATAHSTTAPSTTTTTTTSSDGCRKFELKGTLASVSASSFSATVTQESDAVKGTAGTVVTFAVTADTRVSWRGRGTLTGPNVGDSVKVNGKQCGGPTGALTALKVDASTPKADKKKDEHPKGDASSTTTTTEKHGKSKK